MPLTTCKDKLIKLYRHANAIFNTTNADIILASFPKSGNTWVRFFFCNLISLTEWDGKPVDFELLDSTMPELGFSNLATPWPYKTIPRIIKTHKSHIPWLKGKKSILVIRDPRDTMVSYYHFCLDISLYQFNGEFCDFIRHPRYGLDAWFRYHSWWLSNTEFICYYEDLKKNPFSEFCRMIDYLGLDISSELIKQAIERCSFEQVKKINKLSEAKSKIVSKDFSFARKGKIGEWGSYFNQNDLELYQTLSDQYKLGMQYF